MRKAWLVDQSVSSNARRAASMARSMSPLSASATSPSTSSVAGLTLANVLPDAASTSLPSMSILGSKVMSAGATTTCSFLGGDVGDSLFRSQGLLARDVPLRALLPAAPSVTTWNHNPAGVVNQELGSIRSVVWES